MIVLLILMMMFDHAMNDVLITTFSIDRASSNEQSESMKTEINYSEVKHHIPPHCTPSLLPFFISANILVSTFPPFYKHTSLSFRVMKGNKMFHSIFTSSSFELLKWPFAIFFEVLFVIIVPQLLSYPYDEFN